MSLPREILDQLLSGYLDDALSADERTRVERLLETDPEVAGELQELRRIRSSLQDVSRTDSVVKLPAGFSDQVLDAAIARARSEGVSEDHPLIRLAEQPSTNRAASNSSSSSWRTAGILVAMAASIVVAVFALRPDANPNGPVGPEVAVVDPVEVLDPEQNIVPDPLVPEPSINPNANVEMVAVAPKIGDSSNDRKDPIEVPEQPEIKQPEIARPEIASPTVEAIVANDPPAMPLVTQRIPIMVLEIRLTDRGRQSQAVRTAMQAAGIGAASEKKVSDEIVGLVNNGAGDNDPAAKVLFLQAPPQNLDKLFLMLFADDEGIESVGFTLVLDAPVLDVVQALPKIDATKVRHTVAWELASDGDLIKSLVSDLGSRQYVSIDKKSADTVAAMAAAPVNNNGPVVNSQMLVLIR